MSGYSERRCSEPTHDFHIPVRPFDENSRDSLEIGFTGHTEIRATGCSDEVGNMSLHREGKMNLKRALETILQHSEEIQKTFPDLSPSFDFIKSHIAKKRKVDELSILEKLEAKLVESIEVPSLNKFRLIRKLDELVTAKKIAEYVEDVISIFERDNNLPLMHVYELGRSFLIASEAYAKLKKKLPFLKWIAKLPKGKKYGKSWTSKIFKVYHFIVKYPLIIKCDMGWTFVYSKMDLIERAITSAEEIKNKWSNL